MYVPYDLDRDIADNFTPLPRGAAQQFGAMTPFFATGSDSSHVFIGACGSTERAVEDANNGGALTSKLFPILERANTENLTYTETILQCSIGAT
jgi:hypothetical protein